MILYGERLIIDTFSIHFFFFYYYYFLHDHGTNVITDLLTEAPRQLEVDTDIKAYRGRAADPESPKRPTKRAFTSSSGRIEAPGARDHTAQLTEQYEKRATEGLAENNRGRQTAALGLQAVSAEAGRTKASDGKCPEIPAKTGPPEAPQHAEEDKGGARAPASSK